MTNDIINNEINELLIFCQDANFNEMVHTPKKEAHISSIDYRKGKRSTTNVKFYTGVYCKEKEEAFQKILIRMLKKLQHDINDNIKLNKIIHSVRNNCYIMVSVSAMLDNFSESLN
jgi:hypothetical protein